MINFSQLAYNVLHPVAGKVPGTLDYGVSEALGIGKKNPNVQGAVPYIGPQNNTQVLGMTTQQFQNTLNRPQTSSLPVTNRTAPPSSGGVGAQGGFDAAQNTINSNTNQGLDFIEEDYNNVLGQLAGQEQSLRGQVDIAGRTISDEAAGVKTQLGQEQATKEQGIQSQQQTAEKESASSMQQARDLFRQTQQQNIAQLSALGISSSSVAEALAERLGVETARRIGGITGSLQEVRQNAAKELARTKDYYQQRITDVTNQVQVQKANIQNSLLSGLNQINSSRQQAATDKSRSRAELISNAQRAIQGLAAQQQEFENSLKAWATKKSAALTPIITDPQWIQAYQNNINTLNQQPGISQTYLGNYGTNQQGEFGYYNGPLRTSAKPKNTQTDEDLSFLE